MDLSKKWDKNLNWLLDNKYCNVFKRISHVGLAIIFLKCMQVHHNVLFLRFLHLCFTFQSPFFLPSGNCLVAYIQKTDTGIAKPASRDNC